MRRLIVNADDFGLTSGVNRAILEAHSRGIVTSATLMANGSAFAEAVTMAGTVPRLSLGCHVVLVDGSPVLDPSQAASLLGPGQREFRRGMAGFAMQAMRGLLSPCEVEAEATAQIHKVQSSGVAVSHLDTHKHTHMFPQVLKPLLAAARSCGIRAIRNPVEPIPLMRVIAKPSLWKRWTQVRGLNRVARRFRDAVRKAGLVTSDGTLGIVATGVMDMRLAQKILERIPGGTWELVCHPGYDDRDLAQAGTRLRASRVKELEILTSPAIRELLEKHEVQLVSYRDIQ